MANLEKYKNIPQGDMPGDKIEIGEGHVDKATLIYPILKEKIEVLFFLPGLIIDALEHSDGSYLQAWAEELMIQKISSCSGKTVLKNRRLVPQSFAGDVTYAMTSLWPKIFVMTRRTAI